MKRIARRVTIIITAIFLFAGISYSYWTDEVDVFVNAGTGEVDLKIISASVLSGSNQNITLQNYKNVEDIKILRLDDNEVKISIKFKNTGTIPVHVDYLKLYGFNLIDGKKNDSKDIDVVVELFLKGNRVLYKETDLGKIEGNGKSITIKPNRTIRLEPNEEATVHLTLAYGTKKDKENNGKGNDKDEDKDKNKNVSFDFDLGIIYSRYNK